MVGGIFFGFSFLSLAIQFISYEFFFYLWKKLGIVWVLFNLAISAFLIIGSIFYFVDTLQSKTKDFDVRWQNLSTFSKAYYDGDIQNMYKKYKMNMIFLVVFGFIDGLLYLVQAILLVVLLVLRRSTPVNWQPKIEGQLPEKSKSGVEVLETMPEKVYMKTIKKKKKKGKKGGRSGTGSESDEEGTIQKKLTIPQAMMKQDARQNSPSPFKRSADPNHPGFNASM